MLLSQKVQEIEEVFSHLDQEIGKFQGWSALGCKAGCGKCCLKPDIEATVLEFLPFAHHLFEAGQSMDWLETFRQNPTATCQLFKPTGAGTGSCSEYPYRGLICRLFGFSARTDKHGRKQLVTCQVIKTEQAETFSGAEKKIDEGASVPVMNHYYMRLYAIDPDLARDCYPINEAIKRAIETVLHYYAYRS